MNVVNVSLKIIQSQKRFFGDFFSFLFLKKETKNLRCAKIPKNTNKKAKTFKLLLLALTLCLKTNDSILRTFSSAGIKSSLTSVEQ